MTWHKKPPFTKGRLFVQFALMRQSLFLALQSLSIHAFAL